MFGIRCEGIEALMDDSQMKTPSIHLARPAPASAPTQESSFFAEAATGAPLHERPPAEMAAPCRTSNGALAPRTASPVQFNESPAARATTPSQIKPFVASELHGLLVEFRKALDEVSEAPQGRVESGHSVRRRILENGMFNRYGLAARSPGTTRLLGIAVLRAPQPGDTHVELESIVTSPDTHGVGRSLVACALNAAWSDGHERSLTAESFTAARDFYTRLGFVERDDGRYELHPQQRADIWTQNADGHWQ